MMFVAFIRLACICFFCAALTRASKKRQEATAAMDYA